MVSVFISMNVVRFSVFPSLQKKNKNKTKQNKKKHPSVICSEAKNKHITLVLKGASSVDFQISHSIYSFETFHVFYYRPNYKHMILYKNIVI